MSQEDSDFHFPFHFHLPAAVPPAGAPPHPLAPLSPRYHLAATSDNTRRAYQADIRHFETAGGRLPATPDNILHYLHAFAETLNPRTLNRRITALSQWHRTQGFPDPTRPAIVSKTLIGIARIHGRPKNKAPPLSPAHLLHVVTSLSAHPSLTARRDNALLQIGFFGAFRRSELVALRIEHLNWQPDGLEILIPHSKTDPLHTGQHCVIPPGKGPLCALRALQTWITEAGITEGFVFRRIQRNHALSPRHIGADAVSLILKKCLQAAGVDHASTFSSHSLRRGLATSASRAGASLPAIMRQGRWKQVNTVLEYIEAAHRFDENAAAPLLQS